MNPVSRNLRALVEQRGLKQSALAAVAGVSEGSVSGWLSGRAWPRTKPLERISEYYGVSLDDLTSESGGLHAQMMGTAVAGTPTRPAPARMVPIHVLGAVHAGSPDEPWEVGGEAMLYEELASKHPKCFALEVNGRCMDRRFTPDDYIFVDPDGEARDGSIVVAMVDGRAVVRRLKMGNGSALLVAESTEPDEHPDVIVGASSDMHVLGTVFWWQSRTEA